MTDCIWLEFDPDKLAMLKQEAYESDEECIRYVVDRCGENLEEDMGFRCEYLIEEVVKDFLNHRK